jgi:hypothetical protein
MGYDNDNWREQEEHWNLVQRTKRDMLRRRKPKRKKPGPKRKKKRYISKAMRPVIEVLRKVKTRRLYQELNRRSQIARKANMSPEQRAETRKRTAATRALRIAACKHTLPPRLRKHTKNKLAKKGMYYCPSCKQTVPPPRVP